MSTPQRPETQPPGSWHADETLLRSYAAGLLDRPAEAAVEAHLTRCAGCRTLVAPAESPHTEDPIWESVAIEIAAPRGRIPHRLLRLVGLRESDLVVLRASGGLHLPWVVAVAVTLVLTAVLGGLPTRDQHVLLVGTVPLLPAVLIALSYDLTDGLRGLVETTPYDKFRLALLRTGLAVVTALPPVAVMALLMPQFSVRMGGWLLPVLALVVLSLHLLTRLSGVVTLLVVCGGWWATVATLDVTDSMSLASRPAAQLATAVFVLVAGVALCLRLSPALSSLTRNQGLS